MDKEDIRLICACQVERRRINDLITQNKREHEDLLKQRRELTDSALGRKFETAPRTIKNVMNKHGGNFA